VTFAILAVPFVLVVRQPDLGTALVLVPVAIAILVGIGVRLRVLGMLAAAGVSALPLFWLVLKPYQRDRLLVYLDPFRNGSVQTVVSPYSVRRKPHAPVSTPLAWSEVKASLDPAEFNIGNFKNRRNRTDPWGQFFTSRENLKAAEKELQRL
jgi:hypothetical protein